MLDLFLLGDNGLTLTEVSRRLSVPKSTAHGVLQTMRARLRLVRPGVEGLLDRPASGFARECRGDPPDRADPGAAAPRATCARVAGDGAPSRVREQRHRRDDMVESPRSLRYFVRLGQCWPMHATSAGKLHLAQLSDAAVRDLAERDGLERITEHTIVDVDALIEELAEARRQGYASQVEEIIEEIVGYAAPSTTRTTGGLTAALTITGPVGR
jgi:DNA-binding IclR family transcriptional regulator